MVAVVLGLGQVVAMWVWLCAMEVGEASVYW